MFTIYPYIMYVPKTGGPQCRPQYTIVLTIIIKTIKKVSLILGNHHISIFPTIHESVTDGSGAAGQDLDADALHLACERTPNFPCITYFPQ